jgi:hypothetical protein
MQFLSYYCASVLLTLCKLSLKHIFVAVKCPDVLSKQITGNTFLHSRKMQQNFRKFSDSRS